MVDESVLYKILVRVTCEIIRQTGDCGYIFMWGNLGDPGVNVNRRFMLLLIFILASIIGVEGASAIPWPVLPGLPLHSIGNTYGEYQFYGGSPYLHPGLDILVPNGTPIYAVRSGYVKAVLTTSADLHWRIAIGDLPGTEECEGWLYAHIDQNTIQVVEGQYVEEGDYLGNIVYWTVADFHHIHFVKIRNTGQPWMSDWEFVGNPLDELDGILDTHTPEIRRCDQERLFAFCENGTSNYFSAGAILSGDVDIIARLSDRINNSDWELAPYTVAYEIYNDTMSTGIIHSLTFTGQLFWTDNVDVIYREDAIFDTEGDYNARVFYHVITNTDGDSVIEVSDTSGCWRTTEFDNGSYWVRVFIADRDGYTTGNYDVEDSMLVEIFNTPPCDCGVFGDVDGDGGYHPLDVVCMVNYVYKGIDHRVTPPNCPKENGDWNCDGTVNPVDVVLYVNYIYKSVGDGPCDPCE